MMDSSDGSYVAVPYLLIVHQGLLSLWNRMTRSEEDSIPILGRTQRLMTTPFQYQMTLALVLLDHAFFRCQAAGRGMHDQIIIIG